jgi:hypothetical protein
MNPVGESGLVLHFILFALALVFFETTPFFGDGVAAAIIRGAGLTALLVIFPASATLMSLTFNPGAALNPASIAEVIRTMGADYLKLLLACAGLALAIELLRTVLGNGILARIPLEIVSVWSMLATFALIGGAIHEHRDDFDIPGHRRDPDEVRAIDRDKERQKTLDRAYTSIRGGLPAEGYRTIKELLAAENDDVDIYQWVFNRMLEWEDQAHALGFASRFIERLVAAGREHGALDLIAQCRRLQRDFTAPPAAAARLAQYARTIGRHGVADELAALSPRAPLP